MSSVENEDKQEPKTFWIEVTGKSDNLPDHLRHKKVESVTFEFHLPYVLEQSSPIPEPVRYTDYSLAFELSVVSQKVKYSDNHITTEKYTKASAKLVWEQNSKTLEQLLSRPLVELTDFPVLVINGLIEAYQLLSGDYFNRQLNPLEIPYISGKIKVMDEPEPLTIQIAHRANRDALTKEQIDSNKWLYFSIQLQSGEPIWLARKTYNQARMADHISSGHMVFVECVTCIEVLSDYFVSAISQKKGLSEQEKKRKLRSTLRKILTEDILEYVKADEVDNYRSLANEWLNTVYSIRNRIVHEAHKTVSKTETGKAIYLTGILAQHIEDTIKDSLMTP